MRYTGMPIWCHSTPSIPHTDVGWSSFCFFNKEFMHNTSRKNLSSIYLDCLKKLCRWLDIMHNACNSACGTPFLNFSCTPLLHPDITKRRHGTGQHIDSHLYYTDLMLASKDSASKPSAGVKLKNPATLLPTLAANNTQ